MLRTHALFLLDVPRHCQIERLPDAVRWLVAQPSGCFVDVRQAMPHITRAEVAVPGLGILQMGVVRQQLANQCGVQLIQRGAVPHSHVIDLVNRLGFAGGSCQ